MSEISSNEKLIDSINYQNGSIVSRQILKKPHGNINLFAFDKDESLTEHTSLLRHLFIWSMARWKS